MKGSAGNVRGEFLVLGVITLMFFAVVLIPLISVPLSKKALRLQCFDNAVNMAEVDRCKTLPKR